MTTDSTSKPALKNNRLGRLDFLIGVLVTNIVFGGIALTLLILGIVLTDDGGSAAWLILLLPAFIFFALNVYVAISLIIRRLHDIGQSGLWVIVFAILSLIPFVNLLISLFLLATPGDINDNDYGPAQKPEGFDLKRILFG